MIQPTHRPAPDASADDQAEWEAAARTMRELNAYVRHLPNEDKIAAMKPRLPTAEDAKAGLFVVLIFGAGVTTGFLLAWGAM